MKIKQLNILKRKAIKSTPLIAWLLICNYSYAQVKIRLAVPDKHEGNYEFDYQFLNKSDSIYVKVYHSSDMGHAYGRGYELNRDLPSGDYEIYINDIIHSKVIIDHSKNEMQKTLYTSNGIIKEIRYHKNDVFIKQDLFDENGRFIYSMEPKN